LVVIDVLDILQVVGPNRQSPFSDRSAIIIVSGVANNQAEDERASDIDCQLNLSNIGDLDSVLGVSTLSTCAIGKVARRRNGTGHAITERIHESAIVIIAVDISQYPKRSLQLAY